MSKTYNGFNVGMLKTARLAGADSATSIALTGIVKDDDAIWAVFTAGTAVASFTDKTSEASISADGYIQLSATDTTGLALLVLWIDKSGGSEA